jgi:predicted nucleic acid-binding protein
MSRSVFVDTSWWIAITDPSDQLHADAVQIAPSLADRKLITSEMVLVELLNAFSAGGSTMRRTAVMMVAIIRSDHQVVPQSGRLFDEALTLYAGRLDKGWSLTDCASMAIMTRHGITDILTHDHHFEQAGFSALLRSRR